MPVPPAGQKFRRALLVSLVTLFGLPPAVHPFLPEPFLPASAAAQSPPPSRSLTPGNPLAGRAWGVYRGPLEHSWSAYRHASGRQSQLLAKIALRPKATWFGPWL